MRDRVLVLLVASAVSVTGLIEYRVLGRLNSLDLQLAELKNIAYTTSAAASPGPARGGRASSTPLLTPVPTGPIDLSGAKTRGATTASVAILEFSDFQCPFCARFAATTFPEIDHDYVATGKVLFAFRHQPLAIHKFAIKAAEAAECAGLQGVFWKMHDELFTRRKFDDVSLRGAAIAAGVKADQFDACVSGGATAAKVQADSQLADNLDVTGTPTFFVGRLTQDGRLQVTDRISGARPVVDFRKALDSALRPH